ncbi:hypothetical protein ACFS4T_03105 [Pseudomonas lini]
MIFRAFSKGAYDKEKVTTDARVMQAQGLDFSWRATFLASFKDCDWRFWFLHFVAAALLRQKRAAPQDFSRMTDKSCIQQSQPRTDALFFGEHHVFTKYEYRTAGVPRFCLDWQLDAGSGGCSR